VSAGAAPIVDARALIRVFPMPAVPVTAVGDLDLQILP
jgi:hypothetical protein